MVLSNTMWLFVCRATFLNCVNVSKSFLVWMDGSANLYSYTLFEVMEILRFSAKLQEVLPKLT